MASILNFALGIVPFCFVDRFVFRLDLGTMIPFLEMDTSNPSLGSDDSCFRICSVALIPTRNFPNLRKIRQEIGTRNKDGYPQTFSFGMVGYGTNLSVFVFVVLSLLLVLAWEETFHDGWKP